MQNNKRKERSAISTSLKHEQEFIVIYENSYKEYRAIIIDCNSKDECIDIIHARGIKAKAFFRMSELIQKFEEKEKLRWKIL